MAEKLTKRELQSPDRFQREASGLLEWAHEHPRHVAAGGAALLILIFAIGLLFDGERDGVDPEAGADLAAALELVNRPVGPAAAGEESFATEEQKQQAIADALAEVRRKHAGTSTAVNATLPLADAKYKLKQYDEALSLYDEYLQKTPKDGALRFLALEGRAQSLEAKEQVEEALQAWDRFAAEAPAHADRALYGKARLLEGQKRYDEARKIYERIQAEHGEGAMARLANERIRELDRVAPAQQSPAAAAEGEGN